MEAVPSKPLFTFLILGYKHREFIREAIEGAFAQTYSPLEIFLSDDCSSDETYQIMEEMAEAYDGEHTVILNRNDPNLGIAAHIDRIGSMMKGEFLVISAGDDASLPGRTTAIYEQWKKAPERAELIYSAAMEVDEEGTELYLRDEALVRQNPQKKDAEELVRTNSYALGATCAVSVGMLREFPPLIPKLICEDHAWPLRARLRGGDIIYIDEPLVRHRHGGVGSRLPKGVRVLDYQQKLLDIRSCDDSQRLEKLCEDHLAYWQLRVAKDEGNFREAARGYSKGFLFWFWSKWFIDGTRRKLGRKSREKWLSSIFPKAAEKTPAPARAGDQK